MKFIYENPNLCFIVVGCMFTGKYINKENNILQSVPSKVHSLLQQTIKWIS